MHQLITKIGKGQRGARNLSWDEAKQAAKAMIEGNATPHQTGAFLMAMRIKLEGVTELASFTAATRSYVAPITTPAGLNVVDVPVYAEKHNTHHVCLPAAIIAASAGAAILFHGIDNPTVSSDLPRVLTQLGISVALQGDDLAGMLQNEGFAYLDLALYHPPLAGLLTLREQLGAQNLFHQVARLLNPMRAHSQVVGVAHPPYLEKIPEVVNMIGGRRLLVFQGVEGFPELSMATLTTMRELRDNRVTPLSLKPEDVRLTPGSFQHMAVNSHAPNDVPAHEADVIQRVLHNQGAGQARFRDWVVYNAAMFLYAGGKAQSIAEGVPLAKRALDSGAAAQKLTDLASNPSPLESAKQTTSGSTPPGLPLQRGGTGPLHPTRKPSPSGGEGASEQKVVRV